MPRKWEQAESCTGVCLQGWKELKPTFVCHIFPMMSWHCFLDQYWFLSYLHDCRGVTPKTPPLKDIAYAYVLVLKEVFPLLSLEFSDFLG